MSVNISPRGEDRQASTVLNIFVNFAWHPFPKVLSGFFFYPLLGRNAQIEEWQELLSTGLLRQSVITVFFAPFLSEEDMGRLAVQTSWCFD